MRRQPLVPLGCLACLLLLGLVAVTGPAAASGTAATAQPVAAVDATNYSYNDTAIVDVARTSDGELYLVGTSGLRQGNATVTKLAADGSTAWTKRFTSANTSVFLAAEPGPSGGAYLVERSFNRSNYGAGASVRLVRLDADGSVVWERGVDARFLSGQNSLAAAGSGVVVASPTPNGRSLQLQRFAADGDLDWNRTVGVRARETSVTATDDGFLVAGSVSFDTPWVMRLDGDGRVRFNETYRGSEAQNVVDAVPTDDGGAILVGQNPRYNDDGAAAWTMRVGADGMARWSRVHTVGTSRLTDVLADDEGLVLVSGSSYSRTADPTITLTRVGYGGAVQGVRRVPGFQRASAVLTGDGRIALAGLVYEAPAQFRSGLRTVPLPSADDTDAAIEPDAGVSSGESHYRGQNLVVSSPRSDGETVDLVAIPGEHDDFERQVVRRLTLDDRGRAVVETATLARGTYVVEVDGEPVFVESGSIVGDSTRERASFRLEEHRIFRLEPESQFVDVADGESTATLSWDSGRDDYVAHVSMTRFRGDRLGEAALESVFEDADGFRGTATVAGTPVARVAVDSPEEIDAAVADLDPGMYDLTVRGADTGDAGAAASARVVVGTADHRPVSVSLASDSLQVAVGNETETNVTVSGLTHGIGAMSMSANRTGQPAVGLRLDVNINGSRSSGSSGWSGHTATAGATSIDGDTANGTVTVGTFGVSAQAREISPEANATNTVQFGLDWVIDERGVPYTVPEDTTVTVEVTDLENTTGEFRGAHGSGHERGSASGSASSSGSVSASG